MNNPQPGRDELGRFITNDATIGQGLDATRDLFDLLITRAQPSLTKQEMERAWASMTRLRLAAEGADAGERPTTEADPT